jgi:hypothetical protein
VRNARSAHNLLHRAWRHGGRWHADGASGRGGGGGGGAPKVGKGGGKAGGKAKGTESDWEAGEGMKARNLGIADAGTMQEVEIQAQALQSASDSGAPFCEACDMQKKADEAAARARGQ